jgi:hypothetical protein
LINIIMFVQAMNFLVALLLLLMLEGNVFWWVVMTEIFAFFWVVKRNWFPGNYKANMLIWHPSKDFSREWKGGSDVCFPIDGQKSWVDA